MQRVKGFTLIELLVVIAVIAVLIAVLIPSLQAARSQAWSVSCMSNEKTLLTGWLMYANDWDGWLVSPRACGEGHKLYDYDSTNWVHRPKDVNGEDLTDYSAITLEDRFRGIRAGTLWKYINDVDVYHCPGDKRNSTLVSPRDSWRSYSISYAFGHISATGFRPGHYRKLYEVQNAALYYVFVEEEGNGIINSNDGLIGIGENQGGWFFAHPAWLEPDEWQFYAHLASFHIKSGMFGFADGHASKQPWRDPRTLEYIKDCKENLDNVWLCRKSPGNEDLRWLYEHFWSKERGKIHFDQHTR